MARPCLLFLFALAACGGDDDVPPDAGPPADAPVDAPRNYVPEPFDPTPATMAYCAAQGRDDAAIEARITGWLAELTLAEKIEMMHGVSLALVDGSFRVAGNERLGIPGLRMLDGPRGLSAFTGKTATSFPVGTMRGATWDPALEERVGRVMAVELRSAGANVLLAPTLNILRHPRWGRAQETYSEDVHHMGDMGVAFIRGVQSEGVLASAKHFAANSIEDTRHRVDVVIDERTLREIYLPHFERAVNEARVASVMSAYNQVNGLYCDLSSHLLTDILKGEWEYAGFVESDWLLGTHGSAASVLAGLDIEMPMAAEFARLARDVANGDLDERDIDRSVRRILRAELCFGLDEAGPPVDDPSMRETPAHLSLAREVATRGIVLLRNEPADGAAPADPPVLPLPGSTSSIAILGRAADVENIGDTGSSAVIPSEVVTALEGITERAGSGVTVTHVPGTSLTAASEAIVRAADAVVIVTGLVAGEEGENIPLSGVGDRESLDVPADDVALIRAVAAIHPRVIVILEGSSAFVTATWDEDVEALLHAFYPGSEGGRAIADILFGDAAPSGRLPFSMPVAEADLPPFDNVSDTVTYGYFHGYRHLAREGVAPRYAFGHGLSYTTFAYSGLALSATTVAPDGMLEATVTVTNTGSVRATETVQLYVHAEGSGVPRADHDLRAFAQVELDPSESADVTLPLRAADLAYFDTATRSFVVEPISYEVRVGASSTDVRAAASFTVE
jgi:beta-glucosidase